MKNFFTYKKSGVDYDLIDPLKKLAQKEGLSTRFNIKKTGFKEISESRGESAYIIESSECYYAFVIEGLGTKNLVADEVRKITGRSYYDLIAQDTVAMIVNDLITVGAKPLTINAYWAVGNSEWFNDKKRMNDLINGWKKACDLAGATWGGGETPVLTDIIYPNTIDLAGSAFGIITPKNRLILGDKIAAGDDIIFLASSGIHANGLTLARKILAKTKDKKAFGQLLLTPTIIYAKVINEILNGGADIHYLVNITGHGWRKLMRAKKSFSYEINDVSSVPEIFQFIQKQARLSDKEMYATFNMGAGFAVIVNPKDAEKVLAVSKKHNIKAWIGGSVNKGPKQVIINPLEFIYKSEELNIRK
ncbi:hypothetical protein A2W14_06820 [Candidatus Gottesmanbacteria bacterium RBG_16_37_8]|uniref:Phosphoribosylformylglycinamidine cyclo-ligase n=1 Tax=Candidatus Gottesmanbacteria bacterium RBG_16_37_8 TaxID=1798371 RepID=A0A1F5YWD1_9BACT|nr:MAG: hypothetical protein A2W14_06820 [Candidatus Gottesmanbacteria bacterium RBG_16_37_8]